MHKVSFFLGLASCFGLLFGLKISPNLRLKKLTTDISFFFNKTTPEIIAHFGYAVEKHHVITEDGYILEMHRIPYGKDGPSAKPRPVAFLMHGLVSSSSDWIADKPDRALAYLLADAGYDVWMNNVRGNTYSRNHITLNPNVDKKKFWEFTWDEMAIYDVPAAIDYVLAETGQKQVYYVGFSMGTTLFFALMSEKSEYKTKITAAALMAPVAYVEHIQGPLRSLADYSDNVDLILSLTGHYEFLPADGKVGDLADSHCTENDTAPACYNILYLIGGFDPEELNEEYMPIVLEHTPAGTSTHTVNHYGQLVNDNTFRKYDWGKRGNNNHYGKDSPPKYNLKVKTPPLGLFWGDNDYLSDPQDVARLVSELKNVALNHRVDWDMWTHLDFVWGIHAKEYVYDYVIDFLAKY